MNSKISQGILAGTVVLALGAGVAYAALAGDDAIKARQACMKANGASMGVMVPIIKGEKHYDAAAIEAALTKVDAACATWNDAFPDDSKTSTALKTRAKPEIWSNRKGFDDAGKVYYTAFTALKATKDEAGFKAAFPMLGKACGSCHENFRAPEK